MPMKEQYPLALHKGMMLVVRYTAEKALGQEEFEITCGVADYKTGQTVMVSVEEVDNIAVESSTKGNLKRNTSEMNKHVAPSSGSDLGGTVMGLVIIVVISVVTMLFVINNRKKRQEGSE